MNDLATRLQGRDDLDRVMSFGGLALAAATAVAYTRMEEGWAAFPASAPGRPPLRCALRAGAGAGPGGHAPAPRPSPPRARYPVAGRRCVLAAGHFLLLLSLLSLAIVLGVDEPGSATFTWTLTATAASALFFAEQLDSPGLGCWACSRRRRPARPAELDRRRCRRQPPSATCSCSRPSVSCCWRGCCDRGDRALARRRYCGSDGADRSRDPGRLRRLRPQPVRARLHLGRRGPPGDEDGWELILVPPASAPSPTAAGSATAAPSIRASSGWDLHRDLRPTATSGAGRCCCSSQRLASFGWALYGDGTRTRRPGTPRPREPIPPPAPPAP